MPRFYLLLLFFFVLPVTLFGQDFQWARQVKGITYDYQESASSIAADGAGNSYIVGHSESTLFDLNPTATGVQIVHNNNQSSRSTAYLIKLDANGNYVWGKTFGTVRYNDNAAEVKIGTDGNIYVGAYIESVNIPMNTYDGCYTLMKISPNGVILNSICFKNNQGFNDLLYVGRFDIDAQNNLYMTGYFYGNVYIDASQPSLIYHQATGGSSFLLKINASGTIDWVQQYDGPNARTGPVIVRPDGNLNLLMGNSTGFSLCEINAVDHTMLWQKDFQNFYCTQLHVGAAGGIVLLCGKNDNGITIDVDPSPAVRSVTERLFFVFLGLDGSFTDVKVYNRPTGIYTDLSFDTLTTDVTGNYYFTGSFNGSVDFNPSSTTGGAWSSSSGDFFCLKLDANRNFDTVFQFGQQTPLLNPFNVCHPVNINCIQVVNDYYYMVGDFIRVCDFNPSSTSEDTYNTINGATENTDGFILKLGACSTAAPNGPTSQSFCTDQNATISTLSPNSSSIQWYSTLTANTPLVAATPLVTGQTYYAGRQSGLCPASPRLPVTVTISPTPTPPTTVNATICQSDGATVASLTATGQGIRWYGSLTATTNLPLTTVLQDQTTYYATQTVNGCESGRALSTVTVTSVAAPTLSSPQTFCVQQHATLAAVAVTGSNLRWYDAATGGNLLASTTLLVDGVTYYVSQTTSSCESMRVPVVITIQNTPAPTGSATQTFCAAQSPTLSALVVSGTLLQWYDAAGAMLSDGTPLIDGVTYYTTQIVNGCESTTRLGVTVALITVLNGNDYAETLCDAGADGMETIDLTSYTAALIANPTNYTFDYYTSLLGATQPLSSDLVPSAAQYLLTVGSAVVYVRIASGTGCHQVVALTLTLVSPPVLAMADVLPLCESASLTIDAGFGFDSYLWSTGASSSSISVSQAGNYAVTVTQNHGSVACSSSKNFTVVLSSIATILSIETQDWTDNENSITVHASAGAYEYSLDGISYQDSNVFTSLPPGTYTVYVRDQNGCGIATQTVYLYVFNKYFTPNNDGYNDTWFLENTIQEPGLQVFIYDRFGRFLKELSGTSSWDGQVNGRALPSDDYWFVVTRGGKDYKGHFTLKR